MLFNLFLLSGGDILAIVLIFIVVIALILIASSVRIVPQAYTYVIERVGSYHKTWSNGIHFLIPFVDRIVKRISLKEQVLDYDPQPVITEDNVTMQIDTIVFFQVTDPKAFTYGAEAPIRAIELLTATTLRNIIGEMELDATLTSRDYINTKMRTILDEATDPWGIKVNRVELKNILPPKDIREAMEKQMRAERGKREAILVAQGQKESDILKAEGFKQAKILEAEAIRQAMIEEAEGERKSVVLKAEGEADAILKIQNATAQGLEYIKNAKVDDPVLTLKAYEALVEVSKGQATKIIIPSEIQGLAGLATSLKEVITTNDGETKVEVKADKDKK